MLLCWQTKPTVYSGKVNAGPSGIHLETIVSFRITVKPYSLQPPWAAESKRMNRNFPCRDIRWLHPHLLQTELFFIELCLPSSQSFLGGKEWGGGMHRDLLLPLAVWQRSVNQLTCRVSVRVAPTQSLLWMIGHRTRTGSVSLEHRYQETSWDLEKAA